MRKWFLAAIAALLFAAGAYAKDKAIKYRGNLLSLPIWTSSTRYGNSPGTVGFNSVNNLPEWLDNNATWHSFASTDAPVFTGTITAATLNVTGTATALTSNVTGTATALTSNVTGTATALTSNVTGTATANVLKATTTFQQTTAYSAAGTALPTCNAGAQGTRAWVTDATAPAYLATYAGGGGVVAPVFCDGTNWLTD